MKKERTLFGLGIWVAILPFLGFPDSWRKILFVISGILIICLASLFRNQYKKQFISKQTESNMHPFLDNIENL